MKLKPLLAAVALGVSSLASYAVDLGPVPPTVTFSSTVSGAFTDSYDFSLGTDSTVTVGAFNSAFSTGGPSFGAIVGFSVWLDSVLLLGGTSTTEANPGLFLITQSRGTVSSLAAGVHTLTISGTGVTGGAATYIGSVQAVPVPEPETYALLLAGLGVVGFVARRRRIG